MKRRPLLLALLLLVAGLIAYANSFRGVFLFDDILHIVLRDAVHELSWDLLRSNRRPAVSVTLAINYAWGELDVIDYHVVNLAVHLLAGLALLGLVRRTLMGIAVGPADWAAFIIAVIWVVHPLNSQPVNYITQRGESMMGLFYLLTMYCVARGPASSRSVPWYLAACFACLLAQWSKGVGVTIPLMVLLYDRTFLAGTFRGALRHRWPLHAAMILCTVVPLIQTGVAPGVINPTSTAVATVGFAYKGVTPAEYFLSQPGVILHYLGLSLWPGTLCLDYGWPVARTAGAIIAPLLVVSGLGLLTTWAVFRKRFIGFLGAWFFIILGPTSSFVPIKDLAFEHRMYLPSAAVVTLLVLGAWRGIQWLQARASLSPRTATILAATAATIVIAAMTARTLTRNRDYRSATAMWTSVVAARPGHARAWNYFGVAVHSTRPDDAIDAYRRAIALDPDEVGTYINFATLLVNLDRHEEAIEPFKAYLAAHPDEAKYRANLAYALMSVGRRDEAFVEYAATVRSDPDHFNARIGYAGGLYRLGRLDEAVDQYGAAILLRPGSTHGWLGRGLSLMRLRRYDEAIADFEMLLQYHPGDPDALSQLERAEQLR